MSRRKGLSYEREVAIQIRAALGLSADDVKRGLSQSRGGTAEEPDVKVPECLGLHIECKRGAKTNPRAALKQASEAIDSYSGKVPVGICRDDREDSFVILRFNDFLEFLRFKYERAQSYKTRLAYVNTGSGDEPEDRDRG